MKKSILNLALCAAVIAPLASCSNEMSYEEKQANAITEMISVGMQPSDQAVSLFGSADVDATRGIINSTKDKYFESEKDDKGKYRNDIGVMMLAKNICIDNINDYQEYAPYKYLQVDWSSPKSETESMYDDVWSVYWKNQAAYAYYKTEVNAQDQAKVDTVGTGIHPDLAESDGKRFYPIGAYHNYWFYAYHPRQTDDKVKYEEKQVSVVFDNLDGTQDVIWGNNYPLNCGHEKYAYSATFFRHAEHRNAADDTAKPVELAFEHKMMQIRFWITAGGTPMDEPTSINKNYARSYQTKVKDISITNIPQNMQLIIANKDDKSLDGKFQPAEGDLGNRTRSYSVKGIEAGVFPTPKNQNYVQGTSSNVPDTLQVGTPMLVPVLTDLNTTPYMVSVTLEYDGATHKLLVPMRLPVSATSDQADKYFKPGYIYDVVLKIYNPEEINLNATLEQWKNATYNPFIATDQYDQTFPIH